MSKYSKLILLLLICLLGRSINARPQEVPSENTEEEAANNNTSSEEAASDTEKSEKNPNAEIIDSDSKLEEELEELIEEEEDDDYYEDYGWSEQIMKPIRNVGQTISNGVNAAAGFANAGADMANQWWNGSGDGEFDDYFENYDDANEQVNSWWDAHIEEAYEYDEDEEDTPDEAAKVEPKKAAVKSEDGNPAVDDEDYEDEDMYDYYDLYSAMRYPKPEESKWEAKQIHNPKDNRVQLQRMKSRQDMPYSMDDYFDFVVIAMCVVLLFIMLMAGVSRYQNQRYLKKTYGRKRLEGKEERRPLMD